MAANSNNPSGSLKKPNKTNSTIHRRTNSGGGLGISTAISNLCKNFDFHGAELNKNESRSLQNGINTTTPTTPTNSSRTTSVSSDNDIVEPITPTISETRATAAAIIGKKSNCECTNISIMQLFHEMKQEFPTIPDEIVAKHVNDNCHQRDICIQLLRDELVLHPSPVQTYPSKVLQQMSHALPKKPLKSIRKAPIPIITTTTNVSPQQQQQQPTTNGGTLWPSISYSHLMKNQEREEQRNHATNLKNENEQEKLRRPMRPTTLSLLPQQQQFQKLQVQLKEHIQNRNQQQQQQQQYENQTPKPIRKAPLPPVPPKPTHLKTTTASSTVSTPESNISLNVSVTSPTRLPYNQSTSSLSTTTPTEATVICNNNNMSKTNGSTSADQSPIRCRTVLNMQPQAPFVRACISTSPTTSPVNASGQKSYTSVNLTLRQPTIADAASQATIDIAAGPGVSSGGGSGFKYSSTSYNPQHGVQETFNITVSDEGSEISASRIRLPNAIPTQLGEDHSYLPKSPMQKIQKNSPACAMISHIFAEETVEIADKLELQKSRRDKLASVLRENKKKLSQIDQKINMLTENISPDVTLRLDDDIKKLRTYCESMLNEIESLRRKANRNQTNSPFHTGRDWRPRPMTNPLPIENCITPSTSCNSMPGYHHEQNCDRCSGQEINQNHYSSSQLQQQPHHDVYNNMLSSDEDVETDDEEDEGDCPLEMWACNMCTFRNHPQLNICECCENVRIQPGTIRIVNGANSAAFSSATGVLPTNNNNSNAAAENNSNLTQLALHS